MEEAEERFGKARVFEVKQTPFPYCFERGNNLQKHWLKCFQQELQMMHLQHRKVVEQAIHFWRKVLPFIPIVASVCYSSPGKINPTISVGQIKYQTSHFYRKTDECPRRVSVYTVSRLCFVRSSIPCCG